LVTAAACDAAPSHAAVRALNLLQAVATEGVELSVCGEDRTVGVLAAVTADGVTRFGQAWDGAAIGACGRVAAAHFVRCDFSEAAWTAITFYGDGMPDGVRRRLDAPVFGWGQRWSRNAAAPLVLYYDVRALPPSETARRLEALAEEEAWPAERRAFGRAVAEFAGAGWLQYVALGGRGGPKLVIAVERAERALALVRRAMPQAADRFETVRRRLHGTVGYLAGALAPEIRWRLYLRAIVTGDVAALVESAR
jgi:hypothetical protein